MRAFDREYFFGMNVEDFLEYRIDGLRFELKETISKLEEVAHSPQELAFVTGKIVNINEEIAYLEYCLNEYKKDEMMGAGV